MLPVLALWLSALALCAVLAFPRIAWDRQALSTIRFAMRILVAIVAALFILPLFLVLGGDRDRDEAYDWS